MATFLRLILVIDNLRVFESIVGLQASARASSLSTLIYFALWGGTRSTQPHAVWPLVAALVVRAMPALTLVSGYLLPFFKRNLREHRWTTVIGLGALDQPFALWPLPWLSLSIPATSTNRPRWTAAPGSRPSGWPSCRSCGRG